MNNEWTSLEPDSQSDFLVGRWHLVQTSLWHEYTFNKRLSLTKVGFRDALLQIRRQAFFPSQGLDSGVLGNSCLLWLEWLDQTDCCEGDASRLARIELPSSPPQPNKRCIQKTMRSCKVARPPFSHRDRSLGQPIRVCMAEFSSALKKLLQPCLQPMLR